jgi:hypothetical protein
MMVALHSYLVAVFACTVRETHRLIDNSSSRLALGWRLIHRQTHHTELLSTEVTYADTWPKQTRLQKETSPIHKTPCGPESCSSSKLKTEHRMLSFPPPSDKLFKDKHLRGNDITKQANEQPPRCISRSSVSRSSPPWPAPSTPDQPGPQTTTAPT